MKWARLNVVVEGQTEETFVTEVLGRHLSGFSIAVSVRMVGHRGRQSRKYKGGLRHIAPLIEDLRRWMREDKASDACFSTMVDLYAYPSDAPGLKEACGLPPGDKVIALETALAATVGDRRFIPYIQLHEFETLLYSDLGKWAVQFPGRDDAIQRLKEDVAQFSDVELINDGLLTAPSKRILKFLPEYQKVVSGSVLAIEIGITRIRNACPHFHDWVCKLEELSQVVGVESEG
ncbi:MAG: DUF4276 family protein [Candidatus Hydrogenedentes bacterium]|nr:DUF4276 family protein [Candidatus Hydrogenedentota bacterium]